MSVPAFQETAQAAEPSAKTATPARKTRLRP
jgi:hypothetical protein